jgi:hypothetical protein
MMSRRRITNIYAENSMGRKGERMTVNRLERRQIHIGGSGLDMGGHSTAYVLADICVMHSEMGWHIYSDQ